MKPEWKKARSSFKIVTGRPIRKRSLRKPRRKWENNIIMDIKEIGVNTRILVDTV